MVCVATFVLACVVDSIDHNYCSYHFDIHELAACRLFICTFALLLIRCRGRGNDLFLHLTHTRFSRASVCLINGSSGWDADKAQSKSMFHAGREMSEITSYMEEYFKHKQQGEAAKETPKASK